jgi:hypothetical protein
MTRTLNPETDIIASRTEGDTFIYTLKGGREVRVPKSAFKGIVEGALGVPQRRMVLAKAVNAR